MSEKPLLLRIIREKDLPNAKIPAAEIEAARTPRGGWTRESLARWGVPWPPRKGWKKALIEGRPIPGKVDQATDAGPKSGTGKTIVIPGDGDPCPRCGIPMQIREHDGVSDEQLRKRFYYSRWFYCMNESCKTENVMPPRYKMNPGESSDLSPDNTKPAVMRPDPADPNERLPWE